RRSLDFLPNRFEMLPGSMQRGPGEEHGEFFPSVAVGLAASADRAQAVGYQLEYLVAHVVAIAVVELLEVIDVHHRDDVTAAHRRERLVERAPAGECGELILEGERVRRLDHRK